MPVQETNVVKTFTLKALGYTKKRMQEMVKKNPKATALVEVLCFVTGYVVVPNKNDASKSSLRFSGSFEIVDRESGEEIIAASAFLPGPAETYLKGQLDGVGEGASIRTALMITLEEDPRDDAITGYKFGMKGFIDKKSASDPFAELRGVFPERPKALKAK